MSTNSSLFDSIASTIRVRQIQSPVGRRDGSETLEDLAGEWEWLEMGSRIPSFTVELVESDGQVVGWWDFEGFALLAGEEYGADPEAERLEQIARPIVPSILVTGDTPVIDVIERLAKDGFLFVVENGDVTGIVSYKNLFGPLGSLCLLALSFELEGTALRLCQAFPQDCCNSLSPVRLEKAFDVF